MRWTARFRHSRTAFVLSLLFIFAPASPAWSSASAYCSAKFAALSEFSYPATLSHLAPEVPHTIKNLPKFLRDKLGAEVVEAAGRTDTRFMVVYGPALQPLEYFDPAKVASIREISNPFGAFNSAEVKLKDGTTTYLLTNINGTSRETQVLSLLKLAGVDSRRIVPLGRSVSYRDVYRRTFRKIGHQPDLVVFGFANTALEGMLENPAIREAAKMLEQNRAYAERKWIKPRYDQHELQYLGVQVVETETGRKVWFIDNEYGDRAGWLMQALNDVGAKRTVFFGTAGSLNPKFKVGDLVSPERFAGPSGRARNARVRSKLPLSGTHGDVDSPSLETLEWVAEQAKQRVDYVEVELQKVLPHVQEDSNFSAYLVISDEINTTHVKDYTLWGESERISTKSKIKSILQEHLHDSGIPAQDLPTRLTVHRFEVPQGGAR